ncbi:MAG: alpha/beta hydrolase [Myxococcales bacterium]|nr:alpha/beta hydrolase [Myxococcales bacterium]
MTALSPRDRTQARALRPFLRLPRVVAAAVSRAAPVVVDGQRLSDATRLALGLQKITPGAPEAMRAPVDRARRDYRRLIEIMEEPAPQLPKVEDRLIPGVGGPISVRVYWPTLAEPSLPITVYYHGGGYVLGDLETHDALCRRVCRRAGCIVVAVDYRLAPENPFPAAVDDALAAFLWVVQRAERLGGDPRRVAVAGDSAGAALATVVCHLARDRELPRPHVQALFYPCVDSLAETRSRELFATGYGLDAEAIAWSLGQYLRPAEADDPRASPLRWPRHDDLPPLILRTAGFDPLRDEAEAYAEVLAAAGVHVDLHRHTSLTHGFVQMSFDPVARAAVDELCDRLSSAFAW